MERYIDADNFLQILDAYYAAFVERQDWSAVDTIRQICQELKDAPAADVVEVEVLKDWLMAMALNCVGETGDISDAIVSIADRLDGLRAFARERREVIMAECKWCVDEICVNADCPMRADYCPVPNDDGVCIYEERVSQPDYKEYARQLRENAGKDCYGNIICSPELWEEIASIIERISEPKERG